MKSRELEKLKSKLPKKGYRIELWKRTGCSMKAIDAVLKGEYENTTIIDAAIELAAEYQDSLKTQTEKINSL